MISSRTPRFTANDVMEVYIRRRLTAEFIRHCLHKSLSMVAGATRWERIVRFSVRVPKTTTPQPEGQVPHGEVKKP